MILRNPLFALTCLSLTVLSACNGSDSAPASASPALASGGGFTDLPLGTSARTVSGQVYDWFWEGDGGCFGSLRSGSEEIQLWSEAGLCEPIEFSDGTRVTLSLIYSPENQYDYANRAMYTIVSF